MRLAQRVPRGVVATVLVAVGLLLVALAGGPPGRDGPPLDPRSDAPLGTSALVALLEGVGATVELSVGLPQASDDVVVLLQDRLDDEQAEDVAAWVGRGGRLVVLDPGSRFAPATSPVGLDDLVAGPVERDTCTIDALGDVTSVDGGSAVRFDPPQTAERCFADGSGAYVVAQQAGPGSVVAVGGAAAVTNELLGERDNAVLAAALVAPEGTESVRFLDPPVPAGGGQRSLPELVPGGVRRALLQLGIAFVLYAAWRAVRLGRPVAEDPPVRVAGSELVAATGRLLSRTRRPDAAAELLRARLRRRLAARVGLGADADVDRLAAAVAARHGVVPAEMSAAIGRDPVRGEDELVEVARSVSSTTSEVLR